MRVLVERPHLLFVATPVAGPLVDGTVVVAARRGPGLASLPRLRVVRREGGAPPAENPIHCPSNEKNGAVAPSVPASAVAASALVARMNNC